MTCAPGSSRRDARSTTAWCGTSTRPPAAAASPSCSSAARLRARRGGRRPLRVIGGNEAFFWITKRIHNRLHGVAGDGGALGEEQRAHYEATLAPNAQALRTEIRRGDAVILHDPQTAGCIPAYRARCSGHLALSRRNGHAQRGSREKGGDSSRHTWPRRMRRSSRARPSRGRGAARAPGHHRALDRRVLPQEPSP